MATAYHEDTSLTLPKPVSEEKVVKFREAYGEPNPYFLAFANEYCRHNPQWLTTSNATYISTGIVNMTQEELLLYNKLTKHADEYLSGIEEISQFTNITLWNSLPSSLTTYTTRRNKYGKEERTR